MVEDINKKSENNEKELKELLRANLARSEEILKICQETKTYIRWQNIWAVLRFLLIFVPIILGFIYLPPLIKEALQSYKSLFQ